MTLKEIIDGLRGLGHSDALVLSTMLQTYGHFEVIHPAMTSMIPPKPVPDKLIPDEATGPERLVFVCTTVSGAPEPVFDELWIEEIVRKALKAERASLANDIRSSITNRVMSIGTYEALRSLAEKLEGRMG